MTDSELVKFATEFREGILGNESSDMMCFVVVAPLSGLLQFHGIENKVVGGDVGGEYDCNHVWIQLSDGRVLDPTADQFVGENLPPVYLGPPVSIHSAVKP